MKEDKRVIKKKLSKEEKKLIKEFKKFQETDVEYKKLVESVRGAMIGLFGFEYLRFEVEQNKKTSKQ